MLSFKIPTIGASEKQPLLPRFASSNAFDQLPDNLQFERTGTVAVPCRASIPRITTVKLFGIAVVSAVSASYAPNRRAAVSNALSCAICLIASFHYFFIWQIRAQSWGPVSAYARYMTPVGRGDEKDAKAEVEENMRRLQARETSCDGFRYSDWTATLVLMAIELGRLAEDANPNKTPIVSIYIVSALQPVITSFGGLGRFFANELRPGEDGKYPDICSAEGLGLVFGFFCYVVSFAVFAFTSVVQLDHVGSLSDITDPDRMLDGQIVYIVVLVQIGYSLVAVGSVAYLIWIRLPADMYSPNLSFAKDVAFSTLDLSTKFTLALYIAVARNPP